jgi:CheY-like chemotaxis protein
MNLAARLQSAAPRGGILISHDTYSYVRGVFDLTPRPPLIFKGKSEPLQTFLVRRAKPRPFHSEARGVAGVETSTVGREPEIQTLQAAYLRAYQCKSIVWAQLLSDPGIGKSRLVEDLKEWLDLREETTWLLRARAFPDDANQPFALVRRMWFDRFQIALELVNKQFPDLVLMDIALPGMDGLTCLVEIKQRCLQTRSVVISYHEEQPYIQKAMQAGASAFVAKRRMYQDLSPILHNPCWARRPQSRLIRLGKVRHDIYF